MNNRKHFIFPVLFLLSLLALAMKKFMIPFHGLFLIIVFDSMALIYFMMAFTAKKFNDTSRGRSFHFDITYIIYAICSISILYRLQYWENWEHWITVAGVLFLLVSIITIFAIGLLIRHPDRKNRVVLFLNAHVSWIYFLLIFTPVALSNPRTFHNFFNATTYEEYVRIRYPREEGTALLERYKPSGVHSLKRADEYYSSAVSAEKNEEYAESLCFYNKSIDLNPDNPIAIYNRGRLKLTKLEINKEMALSAYDDFTRAIELDSNMALAYYHRAVVHNFLNKKNRLPAHNDLLKARDLDTSLYHDKFVIEFLLLPLINIETDTTTYVDFDKDE